MLLTSMRCSLRAPFQCPPLLSQREQAFQSQTRNPRSRGPKCDRWCTLWFHLRAAAAAAAAAVLKPYPTSLLQQTNHPVLLQHFSSFTSPAPLSAAAPNGAVVATTSCCGWRRSRWAPEAPFQRCFHALPGQIHAQQPPRHTGMGPAGGSAAAKDRISFF
jgi:hypothetical protein